MRNGLALFFLLLLTSCIFNTEPVRTTFVLPPTVTPGAGTAMTSLSWATATVTRGDLTPVVSAQGAFVAKREQLLFFTTTGRIKEVYAGAGAAVAVGDPLAALDTTVLEQTAVQRSAELTIAELELAKFGSQAEAPVDDDAPVTNINLAIARERVKLAQALYDIAQAQLAGAVLTAPFSGTLSSFNVKQGESVVAYETIGKIADTSEVYAQVMVPASDISLVQLGASAQVQSGGQVLTARVTAVEENAILWQGERAHQVSLAFNAGQDVILDMNSAAVAEICAEKRENVLLLPVTAVDFFPGQSYVNIVEGANLSRVPVQVGGNDGAQVEITGGLEEGTIVALP